MSNVLIGVIGVILFIGLALAGALFLGDRFSNSKTDSEAARFISEGAQIARAYEMFQVQEGGYPTGNGFPAATLDQSRLLEMVDRGYLKSIPEGGKRNVDNPNVTEWYIDNEKGTALTLIGTDEGSAKVCAAARRQAGFSGEIDDIKLCSASDIANNDPCCTAR